METGYDFTPLPHDEEFDRIAEEAGCRILNWTVDSVITSQPCHYLLMLENDEGRDLTAYDQYADQVLRGINVRYEHFTDRGVLGKVKIVNLEPGANAAWIRNKEKASGTSVSTIKPVRVLDTDEKKAFFRAQIIPG